MFTIPLIIRFFLKNERNFRGNQLLDGCIGLSPLRRRRTICPSISQRDFARDSPDVAFFRHFRWVFPRVHTYALTQTTRKTTVSGVCMCVCVCVVVYCVCCAVLCVWKTLKTRGNRKKCVWYGVCVVWCCEVRKYTRITGNIGKIHKTWSLFLARYDHPRTEKRSKIGHFPQRIVFTFPLGFADDFGPRS